MKSSNQYEIKSDMGQRVCIIDIICGAGGLTHDFRLEGYRVAKKESKLTWLFGIYLQITIMLRMIKSVSAVLMPMKLMNASLKVSRKFYLVVRPVGLFRSIRKTKMTRYDLCWTNLLC